MLYCIHLVGGASQCLMLRILSGLRMLVPAIPAQIDMLVFVK